MNTLEENGILHMLKGALKQKFALLTNDDQLFKEGEKQKMFGNFRVNLGKTKEELRRIIAAL